MLGLKFTYFVLMNGKVCDIREGQMPAGESPRVPYHMTFGSVFPGTSGQKRAIPDVSPADLQDFLSPVFQLTPGQRSTGNFCAVLQPGHGVIIASKSNIVHKSCGRK